MIDFEQFGARLRELHASLKASQKECYAAACAPDVAQAAARYHGMRRSDHPGRDQLVYRAGAAMEVAGTLHLNDYWLLGLLTAPEAAFWLAEIMLKRATSNDGEVELSLVDLMSILFHDEKRRSYLVNLGAWRRHHWSRSAYRMAVEEFEASAAASGGRWEVRRPTELQRYAIEQICRTLIAIDPDFDAPDIQTRRAAHDWIAGHCGNPRFADDLTPPRLEDFL